MTDSQSSIAISIVVPLYNEEPSIRELYRRLTEVLQAIGRTYEIIFVDDFSRDTTREIVREFVSKDPHITLVELLNNFGQTGAIAAGIDRAEGEIIIPMDGDLQHAPEDIPNFLKEMDTGQWDIVSGWRKKRVDGLILRRIPSKVANWLLSKASGVKLHDFGTTFKAYRKPVIKSVNLYGDFHRFIPFLVKERLRKVRIKEIPIQNIVRPHGESNYGLTSRTLTVFFDLVRMKYLSSFRTRPLHVFGGLGLSLAALGFMGLGVFAIDRLVYGTTITSGLGVPLFISCMFLVGTGLQMLLIGLFAEMLVKNHFDHAHVRPYVVGKVLTQKSLS